MYWWHGSNFDRAKITGDSRRVVPVNFILNDGEAVCDIEHVGRQRQGDARQSMKTRRCLSVVSFLSA